MSVTKKAVSFTLTKEIVNWVKKSAKSQGMNRSQLVEKALELMREQGLRYDLMESFKRVKNDPEMKELANMGMGDYLELIDRYGAAR